jgi:hypothetical protein
MTSIERAGPSPAHDPARVSAITSRLSASLGRRRRMRSMLTLCRMARSHGKRALSSVMAAWLFQARSKQSCKRSSAVATSPASAIAYRRRRGRASARAAPNGVVTCAVQSGYPMRETHRQRALFRGFAEQATSTAGKQAQIGPARWLPARKGTTDESDWSRGGCDHGLNRPGSCIKNDVFFYPFISSPTRIPTFLKTRSSAGGRARQACDRAFPLEFRRAEFDLRLSRLRSGCTDAVKRTVCECLSRLACK